MARNFQNKISLFFIVGLIISQGCVLNEVNVSSNSKTDEKLNSDDEKNRETGSENSWDYDNTITDSNNTSSVSKINSPYSYGGISLNEVMQQNPCRNGYDGVSGFDEPYSGQRFSVQISSVTTAIPPNDLYVGVTSFGDVAVLVGQPTGRPPLFVGYMCPRSFAFTGQVKLVGIKIGAYSNCPFKPITAASMIFPGGGSVEFRWMDGGSSLGSSFSFCKNISGSNDEGTEESNNCYLNTNNYWHTQGCPGFCQNYPTHTSCYSGGSNVTINPYTNVSSNPINQNWGVQYPGGEPAENCSTTYAPTGINFAPFETRKATVAIQGKTFYSPASPIATQYLNTSSVLKGVASAKTFFQTDSVLKVRFKPRTQPENTQSSPYCYIPDYTKMSSIAGYTKLQFSISLVGTKADGTTQTEPIGNYNVNVNSCTQAIDLSSYTSTYPNGVYLIVQSVRGNQGVFPNDYHLYGFKNSNVFSDVRSMDCWTMDLEVATDGTKSFD